MRFSAINCSFLHFEIELKKVILLLFIFSVVQQPETELITPNHHDPPTPSPPVVSSPIPMVQDLTTPLYLHRQVDKVIVQQQADHREETVIQPVPDDKAQDKDVAGVVVETVKATDDEGNPIRQRDIQVIAPTFSFQRHRGFKSIDFKQCRNHIKELVIKTNLC